MAQATYLGRGHTHAGGSAKHTHAGKNVGHTHEPQPVAQQAPCQFYTRDQGCPLHGETCRS